MAILEAATEFVATQGLGAPTAQIAKRAGVAEGTLFRYFATKDELLNALYLHIKSELAEFIRNSFDETASLKQRVQAVWNSYIEWGLNNPIACRAVNQLTVSDKIQQNTREAVKKLFPDVCGVTESRKYPGMSEQQSIEFSDAILTALSQVAMTFAANHREISEAYKAAGFEAMWCTLNRE